ncbi:MAG: MlaD family protein [Pseudomonadota bacterium]
METRASFVVVGALVMIVVAAAFGFILWKGNAAREFDTYDIVFYEPVSGLSNGSIVRFNGIQAGEVDELSWDEEDPEITIARVRIQKGTPIREDTKVELEFVGFTGLAIIQFRGGTKGAPLLKDVSDERIPTINAEPSGFAMILESSGDVIAQANRLLSDDNIENLSSIIANIETVTGAVADNSADIDLMMANADTFLVEMAAAAEKLNAAAEGIQIILEEEGPAAVIEARLLAEDLRVLVGDTNDTLNENREAIRIFADQGLGQVAPALGEARRLMRSLDYMLREIDRDPQAYFLGETAPEYGGTEE